nr:DUF3352 domain-containing protein [Calothrix rhizosoleniae]
MRPRSVFSLIAIGAVALLLIGSAIFYWLLPRNTPSLITNRGTISEPSAAIFIPKQAPIMVSMLVNPEDLPALSRNGISSQLQNSVSRSA